MPVSPRMLRATLGVGAVAAIFLVAAGCGAIEDFPVGDTPSGPVCYSDSDCVPNDCCGEGTGAVHRTLAPDCTGVSCDGSCDPASIDCGCGIPYCKDSHCATATRETCL